jgi:hypothetical protein
MLRIATVLKHRKLTCILCSLQETIWEEQQEQKESEKIWGRWEALTDDHVLTTGTK